jgi:hypothetical protein
MGRGGTNVSGKGGDGVERTSETKRVSKRGREVGRLEEKHWRKQVTNVTEDPKPAQGGTKHRGQKQRLAVSNTAIR